MSTELWQGWTFDSLGELGYAFELLLGAITLVMGSIGVFLCLIGAHGSFETAFIGPEHGAPGEDRPLSETVPCGEGGQVTIRLEPRRFRLFRRQRCVVTIQRALENACDKDREVWYAKGDG
jgi:hypothetical protein